MVMTILEARVPEDRWAALEQAYGEADAQTPRGIGLAHSYLVQSVEDEAVWRIVSVWSSWEALEEVRRSGETPRGLQIFHSVGANPEASVFDVIRKR